MALYERQSPVARGVDQRAEHECPIGRAEESVDGVLGMRHQAEHVPVRIEDAGDGRNRAVRVLLVAQDDLPIAVELLEQVEAPLAGAILNGVPEAAGYGYSSSHRYYAHGAKR